MSRRAYIRRDRREAERLAARAAADLNKREYGRCGKKKFATPEIADKVAREMAAKRGHEMVIYYCDGGASYHVSRPKAIRRAARRGRKP